MACSAPILWLFDSNPAFGLWFILLLPRLWFFLAPLGGFVLLMPHSTPELESCS
jgi:hypothetical protein